MSEQIPQVSAYEQKQFKFSCLSICVQGLRMWKLDLLHWSQLRRTLNKVGLKCIDRAQGILLVLIGTGLGTNKAKHSGF